MFAQNKRKRKLAKRVSHQLFYYRHAGISYTHFLLSSQERVPYTLGTRQESKKLGT